MYGGISRVNDVKLSLIVPCYNEGNNIRAFWNEVQSQLSILKYEIVFIDDGSEDNTLEVLKALYNEFTDIVQIVSFSRNFGKEAAILAGLKHAKGEYVTIIDADLQQNPRYVLEMVSFLDANKKYDMVASYQENRIEGVFMSGIKALFYKIINKICDIEFYKGASDFRTLRHYVVDAILSMPEYYRFSKGIFSWVGFETYYMPYNAEERNAGETKWSFKSLMRYALEGIVSFTTFPLKIGTYLGIALSSGSMIYMLIVFIQKIFFDINIPGYATLIVLILLLGGVQLLILGMIGEYLGRVYIQGKNRPIYIEKEVYGREEQKFEESNN